MTMTAPQIMLKNHDPPKIMLKNITPSYNADPQKLC